MSGIVLSAAVRQNLLSLQNTAELLSTTQNRLASGKKVNTALDNPTNYFTAQGLDNRASDINNLLDGIGNGVQVLQAANTGLTSLQKLVVTAKSIANQELQTTTGYTTKANVTTTVGAVYDLDFDAGIFGQPGGTLQLQVDVFGVATPLTDTITPGYQFRSNQHASTRAPSPKWPASAGGNQSSRSRRTSRSSVVSSSPSS